MKFPTNSLNKKYFSFINYLKNTWLPRYHDGMLNYSQRDRVEWTNNALERYHQRLQSKVTKNPSAEQFIHELQIEEKYYLDKYLESLTYGHGLNKESQRLKRKREEKQILNSNQFEPLNSNHNQISLLNSKTKHFKHNDEALKSASTSTVKVSIKKILSQQYIMIPWIKWKN